MKEKTINDDATVSDVPADEIAHTLLHPQGMSRAKEILKLIPVTRSTLWRMVTENRFPKPVRLSSHVTVWKNADVLAWIDEQGGNE